MNNNKLTKLNALRFLNLWQRSILKSVLSNLIKAFRLSPSLTKQVTPVFRFECRSVLSANCWKIRLAVFCGFQQFESLKIYIHTLSHQMGSSHTHKHSDREHWHRLSCQLKKDGNARPISASKNLFVSLVAYCSQVSWFSQKVVTQTHWLGGHLLWLFFFTGPLLPLSFPLFHRSLLCEEDSCLSLPDLRSSLWLVPHLFSVSLVAPPCCACVSTQQR